MIVATNSIRDKVSDIAVLRRIIRLIIVMGDDVRPIVQRPVINKFIGNARRKSALDAGCGRGLYTRKLLKVADKVAALDYSKASIDTLRRRLGHLPKLSLYTGSADNLPFDDNQFDIVTHCEVLEHIHDDAKVVSELFRVLQPGGRLVLSVPVPPAPIEDKEHVREGYTLEQITQLLEENGFNVIQHKFCMFSISKRMISFQAWWGSHTKLPLPALTLLPLYWERFVPQKASDRNLPYDVVLEAEKPA